MTAPLLLRGDARALPLADDTVDLIVTSPPYFGLRDYGTDGQIGAEPTPADFLDALIACTGEMARVLKPSGSIFVNLGDKYGRAGGVDRKPRGTTNGDPAGRVAPRQAQRIATVQDKTLLLLPERYRIRCVDELGLIARAVIVWSKPNGLPESVTDRVRRSHEDWVHLTLRPRYFEAVDEIRETYSPNKPWGRRGQHDYRAGSGRDDKGALATDAAWSATDENPLGKLPGSVWTIPTQPLKVPAELGVDHFAAFPMEWPRRLILGWSPREVCTACGEGRRPVRAGAWYFQDPSEDMARRALDRARKLGITPEEVGEAYGIRAIGDDGSGRQTARDRDRVGDPLAERMGSASYARQLRGRTKRAASGYACACPDTTAPATPGVVLDPFSGTGTTALVAAMLGRRGIGVDLSPDYQRLATWRASDPKERARAAGLDPDAVAAIPRQSTGQLGLFDGAAS